MSSSFIFFNNPMRYIQPRRIMSEFALPICTSAILTTTGCTTSKQTTSSTSPLPNTTREVTAITILNKAQQNTIQPDWLSARAKLNINNNGQTYSVSANIVLRRDSVLWMTVKKYGVEIARALVTKDSVHILNRLESEHTVKRLDYLQQQFSLPEGYNVFQSIQTILLGNPLFIHKTPLMFYKKDTTYALSGNENNITSEYLFSAAQFFLKKTLLNDPPHRRKMSIEQASYAMPTNGERQFSYTRTLSIKSPDMGDLSVEMQFSDVEVNMPKNIRFEIPERYRKVN